MGSESRSGSRAVSPCDFYDDFNRATGIPAIGDSYDAALWVNAKCTRKRVIPWAGRSPLLYQVICEYSGQDSPLTEDANKAWQNEVHEEDRWDDADGNAVLNSAGDPIRIRRPFHDKVYNFGRNEATSAFIRTPTYDSVVNTDIITLDGEVCGIGTLLLREISGDRVVDGLNYYWSVRYSIARRSDGWRLPVLQRGPRYRPTAGAPPIPVLDKEGVNEVNLAANGTLLPDGAAPVWISVKRYKTVAFGPLGLY